MGLHWSTLIIPLLLITIESEFSSCPYKNTCLLLRVLRQQQTQPPDWICNIMHARGGFEETAKDMSHQVVGAHTGQTNVPKNRDSQNGFTYLSLFTFVNTWYRGVSVKTVMFQISSLQNPLCSISANYPLPSTEGNFVYLPTKESRNLHNNPLCSISTNSTPINRSIEEN